MDFSKRKPDPYKIKKYISLNTSIPGQGYIWATKHNVEAIKDGDYSRLLPIAAEFDLSTKCIYHCPWCAYRESKEAGGITMHSDQTAQQIIEKLWKAGVKLLVLTGGGEPLLADSLKCTVREARRRAMYVTLYTNGYLLDQKYTDDLLALDISEIRISLNDVSSQKAYEQAHGAKIESNLSVATLLSNILYILRARKVMEKKVRVGVSFVLVDGSAANLTNSLLVLDSALKNSRLSLDYILIRPAINYWPNNRTDYNKYLTNPLDALEKAKAAQAVFRTSELLGNILISPRRFLDIQEEAKGPKYQKCLASNTWMNIGPDTTAYLCCETKHMPQFTLGSALDENIECLLQSDTATRMRETSGSTLGCPTRLCKPAEQNILFNDIESLRDKRTRKLPRGVIHWLDSMNYWAERTSRDSFIQSVSGVYEYPT